jgi:NAD(P)H-dependent flavin oxidoreductase YrpB (nitropropane dioxygenase family)
VRDEIARMRDLTDKPFGVNIAQLMVNDPAIVDFVHDMGVRFVTTSAGDPSLDGILRLYFEGDLDAAFAFGGQVAGRINSIAPVADIVATTITEFHDTLRDLSTRFATRS